MASADFRFDIRTPREARTQWHQIGSPQVRHTSFLPVHRIYVSDSCMSIGHWVIWPHLRLSRLISASCSLNMHFAIGFLQTWCCHYALAESLTLPLIGRVQDSHPIEVRHAGRTRQNPSNCPGFAVSEKAIAFLTYRFSTDRRSSGFLSDP